eukprot:3003873-Amphidinium_carterae.1
MRRESVELNLIEAGMRANQKHENRMVLDFGSMIQSSIASCSVTIESHGTYSPDKIDYIIDNNCFLFWRKLIENYITG